jgi:hypothetical protein
MDPIVKNFWSSENGRKWPTPTGRLFDFGVRRVAEKRPPPEVDRAGVERDVEAKRRARGRAGAWAGAWHGMMDGTWSRGEPVNRLENPGN